MKKNKETEEIKKAEERKENAKRKETKKTKESKANQAENKNAETKENQKKLHFFTKMSTKFVLSICVLAILLTFSTCIIGFWRYQHVIESIFKDQIYSIAYEARSLVDGDAIKRYGETYTKDAEYEAMRNTIETLRENMGVISIFILKIDDEKTDYQRYILDTTDLSYGIPPVELGEYVEIPEGYKSELATGVYYEGTDISDEFLHTYSSRYGLCFYAVIPVYDKNNSVVATLSVQCSDDQITNTLLQCMIFGIVVTAILVTIFLFIYLAYLNRAVVNPIKKITEHASRFIQNNTSMETSATLEKIDTGDEIETLANSLVKMENDIHQYIENLALATATEEHMTVEFNVAKQIQQNLFPCQFPAFPERKDFDIYAELQTCDAIGGNFYNFLLTDDRHLFILLGDVSGNGIPTSMFSVLATTLISNYATQKLTPDKILAYANNDLSRNNHAELTVNVFLGIVNLETGILSYSTAGNMDAFLKCPGSDFEPLPCKKCFSLASLEQVHYSVQEVTLSQGDILFLNTKGISQAVNEKGMIFGSDYTTEKMNDLVKQEFSLKSMTTKFYATLNEFQNGAPQPFDSTILLFRYTGK